MRQATPDLLAIAGPAPAYDLAAAIAGPAPVVDPLRYNYAALGAAGEDIRRHAVAIKAAERRMGEATVEAGRHLIAVRETIPHGHWLPWLADEFGMSDDAAQVTMAVARRFGANTESIRYLSPTVLGLLAAKSVPDAAVEAAIAAAAVSPVTVTAARAIIAQHRPARCRKCGRTLTDPDAIRAGIGACCAARMAQGSAAGEARADAIEAEDRPLPAWASNGNGETVAIPPHFAPVVASVDSTPEPAPAPPRGENGAQGETRTGAPADPRAAALARLAQRLEGWVAELRDVAQQYGELTGDYTTPLGVKRGLERMQVVVQANGENGGWD